MKRKSDVVCFFGESEVDSKKIYSVIDELILCGAERFLFPAHSFFCLDCAKQVLLRKKKQKGNTADKIRISAYIPYEAYIDSQNEKFRNAYFDVVEKCDDVIIFDDEESFVNADFSESILNRCSIAVFAENGAEYEKIYAKATGIKIIGIR